MSPLKGFYTCKCGASVEGKKLCMVCVAKSTRLLLEPQINIAKARVAVIEAAKKWRNDMTFSHDSMLVKAIDNLLKLEKGKK